MLTIRQDQVESFRQNALRKFEDKMVVHLRELFPQITAKLRDLGLRDVIRHGIKRSGEYGISRQGDVGRYIAVILMLGPNFDRKASSGHLFAILRDPCLKSPTARTDALCKAASRALRKRTQTTGKKANW